jgi:hypothetical protein
MRIAVRLFGPKQHTSVFAFHAGFGARFLNSHSIFSLSEPGGNETGVRSQNNLYALLLLLSVFVEIAFRGAYDSPNATPGGCH